MQYRLRFLLLSLTIFSTIFFASCGNTADKTLGKMEDVVSKYEQKARNNVLTTQDVMDMGKQLDSLEQAYSISGDKPETEWTEAEKERYQQLMTRMQKLAYSPGNSGSQ